MAAPPTVPSALVGHPRWTVLGGGSIQAQAGGSRGRRRPGGPPWAQGQALLVRRLVFPGVGCVTVQVEGGPCASSENLPSTPSLADGWELRGQTPRGRRQTTGGQSWLSMAGARVLLRMSPNTLPAQMGPLPTHTHLAWERAARGVAVGSRSAARAPRAAPGSTGLHGPPLSFLLKTQLPGEGLPPSRVLLAEQDGTGPWGQPGEFRWKEGAEVKHSPEDPADSLLRWPTGRPLISRAV